MSTVIQMIASAIEARVNCIKSGNTEWIGRWEERLEKLEELLPSGSGFDNGTKIDLDRSWPRGVVPLITLTTAYHHMNEHGYYIHWSEHDVIVKPTFDGFALRITGRDRNGWKDYAYDLFNDVLSRSYEEEQ